jgi:hypothetical protein
MRKVKLVSVFVLLALLLGASPGAVMGQEPPPPDLEVGVQDGDDEDETRPMRNRMDPNYIYTAEELEMLAAKDALAKQHMQQRVGVRGIGGKWLSVGTWLQPNDWAHRNYCGPGATQVALDARLPYWEVPDIDTIGEEENIDPNSGVWISDIRPVLNERLSTTWYECNGSGSGSTLYHRVVLNIDSDYAMVTGCRTDDMPGWGGHESGHILAVYGYWEPTGNSQYVYYTETSRPVAGYNGPYRRSTTRQTFWGYVSGNDTQVW